MAIDGCKFWMSILFLLLLLVYIEYAISLEFIPFFFIRWFWFCRQQTKLSDSFHCILFFSKQIFKCENSQVFVCVCEWKFFVNSKVARLFFFLFDSSYLISCCCCSFVSVDDFSVFAFISFIHSIPFNSLPIECLDLHTHTYTPHRIPKGFISNQKKNRDQKKESVCVCVYWANTWPLSTIPYINVEKEPKMMENEKKMSIQQNTSVWPQQ